MDLSDTQKDVQGTPGSSSLPATAIVLAVLSAMVVLFNTPPMIWHFRNRNIAAFSLMFWLVVMNLFTFLNILIWKSDDISTWWDGQGLCDIQVRFIIATEFALPGSLLCIMKGLARVMNTDRTVINPSKEEKRLALAFDVCMCFGIPLAMTLLFFVIQPARYSIFALAGCDVSVDISWVTMVLVWLPPLAISVTAAFYAGLVVWRIYRYRKQFSRLLAASNTTRSRFFRLLSMTQILIIGIIPIQVWVLLQNLSVAQFSPYSWSRVHEDWQNKIELIPVGRVLPADRWIRAAAGILAFAFFGTGTDAVEKYRSALVAVGFARIFPSLAHPRRRSPPKRVTLGSIGSRAKSLFSRNHSKTSTNASTVSSGPLSPRSPRPPRFPHASRTPEPMGEMVQEAVQGARFGRILGPSSSDPERGASSSTFNLSPVTESQEADVLKV